MHCSIKKMYRKKGIYCAAVVVLVTGVVVLTVVIFNAVVL
jgi:hypothetical protein